MAFIFDFVPRLLIVAGLALILMSVPIVLAALCFKRVGKYCAVLLFLGSWALGISLWLSSASAVIQIWGTFPLILGILMFGVGVYPMALFAYIFHGRWDLAGVLVGWFALVLILRAIAKRFAEREDVQHEVNMTQSDRQEVAMSL